MSFSFTILGSSSALPTSTRFPSAYVFNSHERIFLIDCGEGAQIQLRRNKVRFGKLNHIFISHLHGDHTFGLFGLLSSLNLIDRTQELHLYGPKELARIIEINFELFDIHLQYPLINHSIDYSKSEQLYEDKYVTIESFPVKHRIPTCGFLFREKSMDRKLLNEGIEKYQIPIHPRAGIKKGADYTTPEGEVIPNREITVDPPRARTMAYCTDTLYHRGLISKIKNVDLLFHEATYMEKDAKKAKETYHSTAQQAAKIAREAQVGKLVLGHFSARYKDLNALLEEGKEIFPNTELAVDGKTFLIER